MADRDFYRILGVPRTASQDEIQRVRAPAPGAGPEAPGRQVVPALRMAGRVRTSTWTTYSAGCSAVDPPAGGDRSPAPTRPPRSS
jgi:hypothetical protein